jgi:predicted oxidoreductase
MTVSQIDLTQNGPQFSRLVVGLWRLADWDLSDRETLNLIHASIDEGITSFDHANIYGDYACEELFGRALALNPALRDQMQIATKCGIALVSDKRPQHALKHYNTSRDHIVTSAENSLRMLRTDHLDLLLIHRPDPFMDPDQVAEAFSALRDSGKVLHFGVSNFTPSQFELLQSRLDFTLVTNQVELSVVNMEVLHDGTADQCQQLGIAPMAWSPLAAGELFGGETEQAVRLRHVLGEVGQALGGAAIDQVALAWILCHPARFLPILGTGKIERIRRSAKAEALSLTRQQWFAIWSASTGTEVP